MLTKCEYIYRFAHCPRDKGQIASQIEHNKPENGVRKYLGLFPIFNQVIRVKTLYEL